MLPMGPGGAAAPQNPLPVPGFTGRWDRGQLMYYDLCSQLAQVQNPTFLWGDFGQDASVSSHVCSVLIKFNACGLNK